MTRIRKLGLVLLPVLIAASALFPIVFSGTASADPGYQYISRRFFNDTFLAQDHVDPENVTEIFGENFGTTEAVYGIGWNCEGEDSFGPICERYYVIDQFDSDWADGEIFFRPICQSYASGCDAGVERGDSLQIDPEEGYDTGMLQFASGGADTIDINDPYGVRTPLEEEVDEEVGNDDDDQPAAAQEEDNNTCESRGGPMGWLLCSGIDLIDGSLNWVDSQIQRLLEIDQDKYTNPTLKRGWAIFRNIAYIILIPIMLVMVIGTALGFEIFSAYTIKKALPRMVIAVIFITLSWYICTALITISNVVGGGMLGLVTAPFRATISEPACQNGALNLACQFSVGNEFSNTSTILRTIVTTAANFGLILGLLIFLVIFGFTIIGGAIGGFIVLVVRQMLIIALILMAPLAILAWIFPGNDKPWSWWWGLFSKLLIMFPLIMTVIAVGRVFAWLINISDEGGFDGWALQPIMKLFAYMLPYALIPLTFKFAGGLMANIAGVVNNPQRGLIDRAKNLRNAGFKKMHENTMAGSGRLFGEGARFGKAGNVYRRGASFGRHGSWGRSAASKKRWEEYRQHHDDQIAAKALEEGGNRAFANDDAGEAAFEVSLIGGNRNDAVNKYVDIKKRRAYAARAKDLGLDDVDQLSEAETNAIDLQNEAAWHEEGVQAMERVEQNTGLKIGTTQMAVAAQRYRTAMTNTAYDKGEEGMAKLKHDLRRLVDTGAVNEYDAAGWMKGNRGRTDFATHSFNETAQFIMSDEPDIVAARKQLEGAFDGAETREILGGHQRAVETYAEVAERRSTDAQARLTAAMHAGASEEDLKPLQAQADYAAADLDAIYNQLKGSSRRKAQVFAENILSKPIEYRVKEKTQGPKYNAAGQQLFIRVNRDGTQTETTANTGRPAVEVDWVWRSKTGTHRQMLEDTRHRPADRDGTQAFLDRSREYGSASEADIAARGSQQAQQQEENNNP